VWKRLVIKVSALSQQEFWKNCWKHEEGLEWSASSHEASQYTPRKNNEISWKS
jgi:hypothetical protein